ncbi:hypothetical protein ACHAPJ_011300 [Fusarium lateritium]
MDEIFTILDDIQVDLTLFTLSERVQRVSLDTSGRQSSEESQWTDKTIYIDVSDGDVTTGGSVCSSLSSAPLIKTQPSKIEVYGDNISTRAQIMHDELQESVYNWLSRIPDRRKVHQPQEGAQATDVAEHPKLPPLLSRRNELLAKTPGTLTTIAEVEESRIFPGSTGENYNSRTIGASIPGGTLDAYHSALLHIQMLTRPGDYETYNNTSPSMRRSFPKRMENNGYR